MSTLHAEARDTTATTRAPIVDVDRHLAETPADLAPYCDLPWQRVLTERGPIPPWSVTNTMHPYLGQRPTAPEPARTPVAFAEALTAQGIDLALALPGPLLKLGMLPTADYAAALARAYNRWLAATWLDAPAPPGLYGAIIAAPHDPTDAAREIERWAGHARIKAVFLPMAGVGALWGNRRYDPIYAAAETAGLPVILHGGGDLLLPSLPQVTTTAANQFEQLALSQPLLATANLVHLIGTGVPARYPGLRIVFLDAGVSWLTHALLRMDKEYNENRRDVPFYTDRVSKWIARQIWIGTHPCEGVATPGDLEVLARVSCGLDRLVYGSNWPHADAESPTRVAAALTDEAVRRQVLGANALDLFRLTAPARA